MMNICHLNLVILGNVLLTKKGKFWEVSYERKDSRMSIYFFGSFDFLSLLHEGIHELLIKSYFIHLLYLYLYIFVIPP